MSKFTSLEETTLRSRGNLRMPYNKTSGCEADISLFHETIQKLFKT